MTAVNAPAATTEALHIEGLRKAYGKAEILRGIDLTVREHEGSGPTFLLQIGEVRDDPVHAEQFGVRKHDTGIDHDGRLTPGERQHVHAEFAKPAERNDFEHSRRRFDTPTPGRSLAGRHGRREPPSGSSIRPLGAPEIRRRVLPTTRVGRTR